MRRRWERVGLGMMAALLVTIALGISGYAEDPCYEDVVVTGCGWEFVNQRLEFVAMGTDFYMQFFFYDYPLYLYESVGDGGVVALGYVEPEGVWCLLAGVGSQMATYAVESDGSSIPTTGWELWSWMGGDQEDYLPPPRISGGEPCDEPIREPTLDLVPTGDAGFLDRGFPEGKEPPVVGEMEVSASYAAGELIGVCCRPVNPDGTPADVPYLTLTWYAVTIGEEYDSRKPIDSTIVRPGPDGAFCFQIDTAGWTRGYYDLRLGIPLESVQWIRVEVTPPLT